MYKSFLLLVLNFGLQVLIFSQNPIKTIAELSNYESTSKNEEVMNIIHQLEKASKFIRIENMASSEGGFEIPLLVIANPLPKSPIDLKNDSRIVVYLQGNIHAGEVEGKEALLMFARELLVHKNHPWLKNIVFLICPNFNPDGNEKISVKNRTNQNGPKNGVGIRYNDAFLDLNRDGLKMESPEMKGLIKNVLNKWDPSVVMDCHTTNGVFRQEPVTFNWMANPNGDTSLINYMRDIMMPEISNILIKKYKVENCFYGEFNDMGNLDSGYVSYAHEPRYMVNYVGLRNRLAILNENYVYADYKSRVEGCYALIQSLAEFIDLNKDKIKKIILCADNKLINRFNVNPYFNQFTFDYRVVPCPKPITIKTYEVVRDTNPQNYIGYLPTSVKKTVTLPYLADYVANSSFPVPYAYLIKIADKSVISLLKEHGIKIEQLNSEQSLEVEKFKISVLRPEMRINQGHYTNQIEGKWIKEKMTFPRGTIIVYTSQILANLAVYLLEPQSGEGFLYWNYFDKYLVPQWGEGFYDYPVYRIPNKTTIK